MSIEIYQWLVPLVSIYFVYRVYDQFKRQKRTRSSLIVWICFWVVIVTLSVIPDLLSSKLAFFLGFKDNVNAVIFVSLGLLFSLTFYYSSRIERLERQIATLVRNQALYQTRHTTAESRKNRVKKDEDTLRA